MLKRAHLLTIKTAPLQTPSSIVSYLSSGPTIICKYGVVLAILSCRDLSMAFIDEIEFKFEFDAGGDTVSGSIF